MEDDVPQPKSNSPERRKRDRSYIQARKDPEVLKEIIFEMKDEIKELNQALEKGRVLRFVNTPSESVAKLKAANPGHPRKMLPDEVTLAIVASHARIHCTDEEFASALKCDLKSWLRLKQDFPEVQQTIDENRGSGKTTLRRKTWQMAEDGHWNAIQHLNRHVLGEHDKTTQDVTVNVFQQLMSLEDNSDQVIDGEVIEPGRLVDRSSDDSEDD